VPRPILRFWGLIVFGHQLTLLDVNECDRIRQTLQRLGERGHSCFMSKSFHDGLSDFYARLLDADRLPIGSIQPQERLDERLLLRRKPA
jgi:hypothetical protein